jgi:hypothetical protein
MMMEALPGTPWFDEIRNAMHRSNVNGLDPLLRGADIGAVCARQGVTVHELADRLEVPFAYAFAVDRGWKRLGTRGLLYVASCLGVGVGSFIRNDDWEQRPRVRIYNAFRLAEREVTHL